MAPAALRQFAQGSLADHLSQGTSEGSPSAQDDQMPSANTSPQACQPMPPHTTGPGCHPTTGPPAC